MTAIGPSPRLFQGLASVITSGSVLGDGLGGFREINSDCLRRGKYRRLDYGLGAHVDLPLSGRDEFRIATPGCSPSGDRM